MTRSTSQVVGVFIILLGGESIKAVDLASLFETLTSLAPLLPSLPLSYPGSWVCPALALLLVFFFFFFSLLILLPIHPRYHLPGFLLQPS